MHHSTVTKPGAGDGPRGKKKLEVPMPVAVATTILDDSKFLRSFVEKHERYAKMAGSGAG